MAGSASRSFSPWRKLRAVLVAAVIAALALTVAAAAAYIYQVLIANWDSDPPSYVVSAEVEPKTISEDALEELSVWPYQGYKATYGEVEDYLGVHLLISERLEAAILGEGVDIQGSNLKGEEPVASITLYSRHDTGAGMSGYIDMSVYISITASDAYQQVTRILDPELMENDAALYEYVSQANGIAARFAVYGALGRASAYFVYDGILYNISVGGFAGEDDIDPASYLEALIDTFR